jgi:uncharacterized Zn finger protein
MSESLSRQLDCPRCETEAQSGIKTGGLLMLRCRACGFGWTVVLSPMKEPEL